MTDKKVLKTIVLAGMAVIMVLDFNGKARGQTAAFQPEVSSAFSGALVDVLPVVSPDRRYVRMNVSASFSQLNGFTTYSVPIAAGGVIGGGGGLMGMNGPQGAGAGGSGFARVAVSDQAGEPLAGTFAATAQFGDGFNREFSDWPMVSPDLELPAPGASPSRPIASADGLKARRARRTIDAPAVRSRDQSEVVATSGAVISQFDSRSLAVGRSRMDPV